jgi:dATP pyrophosphohydrolase
MPRAPFNVLVLPYRQAGQDEFEHAIFLRSDAGFWQSISGGGEDEETPQQTARREAFEEAGIPPASVYLPLDSVESVPVVEYRCCQHWGEDIFVIPQYSFGVRVDNPQLVLSLEHTEYRWLHFAEASAMLRYDGNRTALWELNQRLRGRGPRG